MMPVSPNLPAHLPAELLEWLRPVEDPEMKVSVVDLGLIYECEVNSEFFVNVKMTLTSPACPVAGHFVELVKKRLLEHPAVKGADVQLVFAPKWDPKTMASDEVKERLGIW